VQGLPVGRDLDLRCGGRGLLHGGAGFLGTRRDGALVRRFLACGERASPAACDRGDGELALYDFANSDGSRIDSAIVDAVEFARRRLLDFVYWLRSSTSCFLETSRQKRKISG
jgi:hypothetical protein